LLIGRESPVAICNINACVRAIAPVSLLYCVA
jgi:hypothetical protein